MYNLFANYRWSFELRIIIIGRLSISRPQMCTHVPLQAIIHSKTANRNGLRKRKRMRVDLVSRRRTGFAFAPTSYCGVGTSSEPVSCVVLGFKRNNYQLKGSTQYLLLFTPVKYIYNLLGVGRLRCSLME